MPDGDLPQGDATPTLGGTDPQVSAESQDDERATAPLESTGSTRAAGTTESAGATEAAGATEPTQRVATGDEVVDEALGRLGGVEQEPLAAHIEAAERVHDTLQSRLSDLGDA